MSSAQIARLPPRCCGPPGPAARPPAQRVVFWRSSRVMTSLSCIRRGSRIDGNCGRTMFLKARNRLSINDLRPTQKGHSINATQRFDSRGASSSEPFAFCLWPMYDTVDLRSRSDEQVATSRSQNSRRQCQHRAGKAAQSGSVKSHPQQEHSFTDVSGCISVEQGFRWAAWNFWQPQLCFSKHHSHLYTLLCGVRTRPFA